MLALALIAALCWSACGKPAPPRATKAPEAATGAPAAAAVTAAGDAAAAANVVDREPKKTIPTTTSNAAARKAYEAGEANYFNYRDAEALERFEEALRLDPGFAKARAMIGYLEPGDEGMAMLRQALDSAGELPTIERLWIEALLVQREGRDARWAWLNRRIVKLAPDDWRGYFGLGQHALYANDLEAAIDAFAQVVALKPRASVAYNQLGYAYLRAGRKAESIAAFTTYMELTPNEPNPHDSLGEALLAAGRLAEAEASFRKAVEVAPSFAAAWGGVSICRAMVGDWSSAEEAIDKLATATTTIERREARVQRAWLHAARGDLAAAGEVLETLREESEQEGDATEATNALVTLAVIQLEEDALDDTARVLDGAWTRGERATWVGADLIAAKRRIVGLRAVLAARTGRAAAADRLLKELSAAVPDNNPAARAEERRLRGMALLVSDPEAALEAFGGCLDQDAICRRHAIEARDKLDDTKGVEVAKQGLLETPWRDMTYVYVRAKLGMIPEAIRQ